MPDEVAQKPVSYRPIGETNADGTPNRWYVEMRRLVAQYHPHLVDVNIGLIWRRGIKPDKDGKLILGQARKPAEPDRPFHGYHCSIVLNEEYFHNQGVPDLHKIIVLDHELCHLKRELDKNGDPRHDCVGS